MAVKFEIFKFGGKNFKKFSGKKIFKFGGKIKINKLKYYTEINLRLPWQHPRIQTLGFSIKVIGFLKNNNLVQYVNVIMKIIVTFR